MGRRLVSKGVARLNLPKETLDVLEAELRRDLAESNETHGNVFYRAETLANKKPMGLGADAISIGGLATISAIPNDAEMQSVVICIILEPSPKLNFWRDDFAIYLRSEWDEENNPLY